MKNKREPEVRKVFSYAWRKRSVRASNHHDPESALLHRPTEPHHYPPLYVNAVLEGSDAVADQPSQSTRIQSHTLRHIHQPGHSPAPALQSRSALRASILQMKTKRTILVARTMEACYDQSRMRKIMAPGAVHHHLFSQLGGEGILGLLDLPNAGAAITIPRPSIPSIHHNQTSLIGSSKLGSVHGPPDPRVHRIMSDPVAGRMPIQLMISESLLRHLALLERLTRRLLSASFQTVNNMKPHRRG